MALKSKPLSNVRDLTAASVQQAEVMTDHARSEVIHDVPIASIRRSRYQVRSMGDDTYIESLAEAIAESGLISPIVLRPLPPTTGSSTFELFEFVAGEHRAEACKRLGHATIKAIIRPLTDKEAALALATDNAVRKNLDDFDRFQHAQMLRLNGFCKTDKDVASVLGMSKSHVSMLSAFSALPDEAKALLIQHPGILGAATAYQLRDLIASEPVLFTLALEAVAHDKLKQSGIRAWVESHGAALVRGSNKTTIKLGRPGSPPMKLMLSENEAIVRCDGLNTENFRALIEANLDLLFPDPVPGEPV